MNWIYLRVDTEMDSFILSCEEEKIESAVMHIFREFDWYTYWIINLKGKDQLEILGLGEVLKK